MSAARLVLLTAVAASLLAPGTAGAALGWHDGDPDDLIPDTATLNDVAVMGTGLVAVGKETVTLTAENGTETTEVQAAIYRYSNGAWQREALTDSLGKPILGELVEIAVHGGVAWAVGTRADNTPDGTPDVTPLLVKSAAAPGTWEAVAVDDKRVGEPLSVSLSNAGGYVGDDSGQLWPIAGGALGSTPIETARDAAVHGIAAGDDGTAVAVTDGVSTDARIFDVKPGAALAPPAPAVPDTANQPLVAVARAGTAVLAVDAGGYWWLDGQAWKRSTTGLGAGTLQLSDVSVGPGIDAIAGQVGADGYVWRRGADRQWSRLKVTDGAAINGVVALAAADVWAVGAQGAVLRYYDKPPPPPEECSVNCGGGETGGGGTDGGGSGDSGSGGSGGSGTNPDPAPSAPTSSTRSNTTTAIAPQKSGDPTVFVVEPKRPAKKRGGKNRRSRRLVDRVKVVRRTRRLIVSFRLRARARVAVSARRGRAVISRARSRKMRPGRRRVVLRFRGKPPTALRIVVRPLRAKKAR